MDFEKIFFGIFLIENFGISEISKFRENLDFGGNFQENLASRQGSIIRENELSENISTLLQPDEVYKYQVMQSGHLKARE